MVSSNAQRERIRVSVCSLTSMADLQACVRGGADAVGVLVLTRHKAEDAIELPLARDLLSRVPPYVGRYAVTHATTLQDLTEIVDALPIDTLQLHDDVSVEDALELKRLYPTLRTIKAVHIDDSGEAALGQWDEVADAIVFDSINRSEDRIGGTGQTHDWKVSAELAKRCRARVVLAGGLNPENVRGGVEVVKPWAVNVNSGVEKAGKKDPGLVGAFVKGANLRIS